MRQAREMENILLEEAANDIKISKRYLEALEENDYSIFPAPIYIRGFLSNYARYLGLDPKAILEQYNKLTLSASEEIENIVPKRATRRVMRKRVIMLLAALLFMILCLLWLLKYWLGRT